MLKYTTCLLFSLVLAVATFSQDTITVFYDSDWDEVSNQNKAAYYRKAFRSTGKNWVAHDYYINDTIQMTGTYKSKKMKVKMGVFTYYHENGQKSSEGLYVNNKKQGLWHNWYADGQIEYTGSFDAEVATDEWEYWHENGERKAIGQYKANLKDGEWNYWTDKGVLESKEHHKNGSMGSIEGYFENGNVQYTGVFQNNIPNGLWQYWTIDGRLMLEGKFVFGLRNGEWVRYFRDGEMKINYLMGAREGKEIGGIVRRE